MEVFQEADIAKIWIEDGVMNIIFHRETALSMELARKVVQHRLALSENKDFPLYIDIRGLISVDLETRRYLKGKEGIKNASAAAIHVENPISKFLGNLFIKVDKPDKPIKMFSHRDKALRWLKQFK